MSNFYFLTDINRRKILMVANSRTELNRKLLQMLDGKNKPTTAMRIHSASEEDLQYFIDEMKNKGLPFNRVARRGTGYVHVVKRE